ncbi:MAG: hypothetical protein WA862_04075 [Solirubrobacterales bacterium]
MTHFTDSGLAREEIELARAREALRQQRLEFDFRMKRAERWSGLQLVMACVSVPAVLAVTVLAGWVMVHSAEFESGVVTMAAAALFVDLLGLFSFVWYRVWRD